VKNSPNKHTNPESQANHFLAFRIPQEKKMRKKGNQRFRAIAEMRKIGIARKRGNPPKVTVMWMIQ
jgi:hypothetical protein